MSSAIRSAIASLALLALALILTLPAQPLHAAPTVVEAEQSVGPGASAYRDDSASGKAVSVVMIERGGTLVSKRIKLPAGDYVMTAFLDATPVSLMHRLDVRMSAGEAAWTAGAIHFDGSAEIPGATAGARPFQPMAMRFTHRGGDVTIKIEASGTVGFDGMRRDNTAEEQADSKKGVQIDASLGESKAKAKEKSDADDFELEENPPISKLTHLDRRVVCDRVEITPIRTPSAVVTEVWVDKVHYLPGATVKAIVRLRGGTGDGTYKLTADLVNELDRSRRVAERDIKLSGSEASEEAFEFALDKTTELGHELRCSLTENGKPIHDNSEFFGVSKTVYRVGITASSGYHGNKSKVTVERARQVMETNKKLYANYCEEFAWAPCDYSNLTPKTEHFWSGQTQYHGTISGFKTLISEAHRAGLKMITYGKAQAGGLEGFLTFQKHPELYHISPFGVANGQNNTYLIERMLRQEFNFPDNPDYRGWQLWADLALCDSDDRPIEKHHRVIDFGSDQLIASAKMFGWDGVRWDGHFENGMARSKKRLNDALPDYVHGYNIAFANPGSELFLPPATKVDDFHECARGHGLMMDESVRDWSNTNFSPGTVRPFYDAICREADYIKRIGGLPLFISFDMGSKQDQAFNILCGLAAGQRYTYGTSPGDWPFGPMPKFLTRYSAFVWDDTALVADADKVVNVTVGNGPKGATPWWNRSTWLRNLPDGKQQLLINLLNPPSYGAFCNRVQTPPATMTDLTIQVALPAVSAGAKAIRAFHVSPDLVEGHVPLTLEATATGVAVKLPRLRTWSIVAIEYGPASGNGSLTSPIFKLTTPVEDAKAYLDKQAADKAAKEQAAKEEQERKVKSGLATTNPGAGTAPAPVAAGPQKPFYEDFENSYNADAGTSSKLKRPIDMNLRRNGVLDVHHCRGVFSWLNPVENAMGLAGGGQYSASWVNFAWWRMRDDGGMEDFPDDYESLLSKDVLVIDNVNANILGSRRRSMINDFVNNGGGLMVFGGYWNLSLGCDRNTALDPLLPVQIKKFNDLVNDNKGMPLKPAKADALGKLDWSKSPMAFSVDVSPLKEGVEVLATVGDKPAIVRHRVGKGRVVTFLINVTGDYPEGVTPYWLWSDWPNLLSRSVRWLGEASGGTYVAKKAAPVLDPKNENPEELAIDAAMLDGPTFTKRLKSAQANMIDARTARAALEAALDNSDKVEDLELLTSVAERAGEFVDASFAPLAKKLVASQHVFLRRVGYQVLGLAGDKSFRAQIEKGLDEEDVVTARASLVGLGRLGDRESIPAVKRYLTRYSEKLLASAVLHRLGDPEALNDGLPRYAADLRRQVAVRCTRLAAFENLYGGTSFKLTPAARRKGEFDLKKAYQNEARCNFDLNYFTQSLNKLDDAQLKVVVDFLCGSDNDYLAPLAFSLAGRTPADRFAPLRLTFASAKIEPLRALASPAKE